MCTPCVLIFARSPPWIYSRDFIFTISLMFFMNPYIEKYWQGLYFHTSAFSRIDAKIKSPRIKSILQYSIEDCRYSVCRLLGCRWNGTVVTVHYLLSFIVLHCFIGFLFQVRKVRVEKRINEIVNRLNKTKEEQHPDFRKMREDRDRQERESQKQKALELRKKEKEVEEQRKVEAEKRWASVKFIDGNSLADTSYVACNGFWCLRIFA